MGAKQAARSPSVFSVASSASEPFEPSVSPPPAKRRKPNPSTRAKPSNATAKRGVKNEAADVLVDIEDLGPSIHRPHGRSYHDVKDVAALQENLLEWFEEVRERRGMPWRKRYDHTLSNEGKGQRAYEIWVSEVMLQQTQVNTVIAYWQRWIEKWPTIADLAKADIEEVNSAWRGLGYYRRARSLLAGAKTVMSDKTYNGRLPAESSVLEKEVDGVGRYTAGAITSMAYGKRAPIVDGNVHRLFTRLFALHATQTAPSTIKFLWNAAEELVDALPRGKGHEGVAGDWNQALMELGSQVCKPVGPDCNACPLQTGCKAFAETTTKPPPAESAVCDLCEPIPSDGRADCIPSVTVFPMKKEKKASREEAEAVCVVEWVSGIGRDAAKQWLLIKRPEKGLLAGLFEPISTPIASKASAVERIEASRQAITDLLDLTDEQREGIQDIREISSIPHIFSHINMTYHVQHLVISGAASEEPPTVSAKAASGRQVVWLDKEGVEHANVGTGVKKVWAEIYGAWGKFDAQTAGTGAEKRPKSKGRGGGVQGTATKKASSARSSSAAGKTVKSELSAATATAPTSDGRKVKKVVIMPTMPGKGARGTG